MAFRRVVQGRLGARAFVMSPVFRRGRVPRHEAIWTFFASPPPVVHQDSTIASYLAAAPRPAGAPRRRPVPFERPGGSRTLCPCWRLCTGTIDGHVDAARPRSATSLRVSTERPSWACDDLVCVICVGMCPCSPTAIVSSRCRARRTLVAHVRHVHAAIAPATAASAITSSWREDARHVEEAGAQAERAVQHASRTGPSSREFVRCPFRSTRPMTASLTILADEHPQFGDAERRDLLEEGFNGTGELPSGPSKIVVTPCRT